jgi:hypothetical protein
MTRARARPIKAKTPLPGEGSGVRVINNFKCRETETAPSNFTIPTDVKLPVSRRLGKRDGDALREPLRR